MNPSSRYLSYLKRFIKCARHWLILIPWPDWRSTVTIIYSLNKVNLFPSEPFQFPISNTTICTVTVLTYNHATCNINNPYKFMGFSSHRLPRAITTVIPVKPYKVSFLISHRPSGWLLLLLYRVCYGTPEQLRKRLKPGHRASTQFLDIDVGVTNFSQVSHAVMTVTEN